MCWSKTLNANDLSVLKVCDSAMLVNLETVWNMCLISPEKESLVDWRYGISFRTTDKGQPFR